MPKRLSEEGGFTLIESLVGIFLISTALLTLMAMFTVSGRTVISGRRRTAATYLAQVMLDRLTNESLVRVGFYDGAITNDTSKYPADDGGDGTAARNALTEWDTLLRDGLGAQAYGTISIDPIQIGIENGVAVYAEGLTRIAVTVVWRSGSSRDSTVELFLTRRL